MRDSDMLTDLNKIQYSLDDTYLKEWKVIANIFSRVRLEDNPLTRKYDLLFDHTIKDGETPDRLAYEKYKNVKYWWTFLVVNPHMKSPSDWPLTSAQINEWIDTNYGNRQFQFADARYTNIPFETESGELIAYHDEGESNFRIDQFRSEIYKENDRKRKIRIINPEYVRDFSDVYITTLKQIKGDVR